MQTHACEERLIPRGNCFIFCIITFRVSELSVFPICLKFGLGSYPLALKPIIYFEAMQKVPKEEESDTETAESNEIRH